MTDVLLVFRLISLFNILLVSYLIFFHSRVLNFDSSLVTAVNLLKGIFSVVVFKIFLYLEVTSDIFTQEGHLVRL